MDAYAKRACNASAQRARVRTQRANYNKTHMKKKTHNMKTIKRNVKTEMYMRMNEDEGAGEDEDEYEIEE